MKIIYDYAMTFMGIPYIYGGDDPMRGFDCSGLVQEILASAGVDPQGDQNAQGLYDYFSQNGKINTWGLGALSFFGKDFKSVSHIGFCLDQYRMLEAGGGTSKTLSAADAVASNAFVRVRLIKNRKDLLAVIMPYYTKIGMA